MPKCFQSRFRSKQRGLVPEFQVIFAALELLLVAFPFLSFWCLDVLFALYWKWAWKERIDSERVRPTLGVTEFRAQCCLLNLLHIFLRLSSYLSMTKHLWKRAYVSQGGRKYCPSWGRPSSSNTGTLQWSHGRAPRPGWCESPSEPYEEHGCLGSHQKVDSVDVGLGPGICVLQYFARGSDDQTNSGSTEPSQSPHLHSGTPQFHPPHWSQRNLSNRQVRSDYIQVL